MFRHGKLVPIGKTLQPPSSIVESLDESTEMYVVIAKNADCAIFSQLALVGMS